MAKTLEIQIPEVSTAEASMGSFTLGRSTSALISCLYSELCSMKSSHPPVRGSSALSTISTFLWSLIISLYLLISFQRSSYLFRLQRRCRLPSLLFGNTGWCPRQGRPVSYQPWLSCTNCPLNSGYMLLSSFADVSDNPSGLRSSCPNVISPKVLSPEILSCSSQNFIMLKKIQKNPKWKIHPKFGLWFDIMETVWLGFTNEDQQGCCPRQLQALSWLSRLMRDRQVLLKCWHM